MIFRHYMDLVLIVKIYGYLCISTGVERKQIWGQILLCIIILVRGELQQQQWCTFLQLNQ